MNNIDEKAILEFAGFNIVDRRSVQSPDEEPIIYYPDGQGHILSEGTYPNIHSLDWQKKYPDKKLTDLGYDIKLFSDDGYYFCNIYENCEDGMSDPVGASIVGTESQAIAKLWAYMSFIENKGIGPPISTSSAGSNGVDRG